MAPLLSTALALLSGVPLVLLGGFLLSLRPRRTEQVFFGLFAAIWGVQVMAANVGLLLDDARVFVYGFLTAAVLSAPGALFLTAFAATVHRGRGVWLLPGAMGLVALAAALVLVVSPSLVLEGLVTSGGDFRVVLGSLAFPLYIIPFFLSVYAALVLLYAKYRAASVGSPRRRYRGMVLALGLYASYQTVTNLAIFLNASLGNNAPLGGDQLVSTGIFVVGAALLLGIVGHLVLRPVGQESRDWTLVLAFLVPGAIALGTELFLGTGYRSWGLWRILAVGVIVHTIARYQLFDIDVKLKTSVHHATVAGAFVVAFLAVSELAEALVADQWGTFSGFLAAAVLTLAFRPLDRAAGRLASHVVPGVEDSEDYLRARKLEVYAAALERTLEDWDPQRTFKDEVMRDLRRSLQVSNAEHHALLRQLLARDPKRPIKTPAVVRVAPGERLAGRYRVGRLLGQGAHGRAHLAYDEQTDTQVVLKVVGVSALGGKVAALLRREADVLASLDHPHVVHVHDLLETPQEMILVLDHAEGGNLRALLDRRRRLGLSEATRILDELLQGLAAAHAHEVVHRDVKPENVLLDGRGTVMLADFGIARDGAGTTALTAGPAGTLLYMAPEQVRGLETDARADLYAAAVLYHEMLTGRHYLPLAGLDDFQIRKGIVDTPARLETKGAPAWVEALLMRALAKDPEARFASAQEMRQALPEAMRTGGTAPEAARARGAGPNAS